MAEQRIQKVLADQGICSRREAERLIAAGKVKVNGHPVTLGDKMDPDYDKVMIDGQTQRIVRKRQYTYIMLHKPRGYLTTRSDDRGRKTVMDLVSDVPAMLRPVGRLDKDSEGLLLMTDDGAFINMLTHPSGGVGKLYRVTVNPRATEQQSSRCQAALYWMTASRRSPVSSMSSWTSRAAVCWRSPCMRAATARSAACAPQSACRSCACAAAPRVPSSSACCSPVSTAS